MSGNNSLGILLHIRKDKLNNIGEAPIYLRVTVNGKRSEIATKQFVVPEKWNSQAGQIKGTKEDIKVKNQYLLGLKNKAHEIYQRFISLEKPVSSDLIKDTLLNKRQPSKKVLEIYKEHNDIVKKTIGKDFAEGTYKRYETSLSHVAEFIKKEYNKDDLYLTELDFNFIENFFLFLKTTRNCNHNSALKYIRNFRKIIHLSVKRGVLDKDPFALFEEKLEETKRVYLTQEELDKIENKVFKIARLEQIRDFFVFTCYTAFPYVEIEKLTPKHVQTGFDGNKWIIINRTKTGTNCDVPILKKADEIINKYKDHPDSIRRGKLFPIPSNVKYNAYLKEIADLCGIDKNITTHVGRHTFGTTVGLANGLSLEVISYIMGHTSIRTTQIYAKMNKQIVAVEMKKLNQKLEEKYEKN